jgi:hypothetical protein
MAFSGVKSAVHSSFKSEHLRAIVTPHGGDSHGEAGGAANRLGERKLELRRVALVLLVFVCTFIGTALSLGRTVRGCVLTSVRYGIPVLDLLSARPAAADVGQGV